MRDSENKKNLPAVAAVLDRLEDLGNSASRVALTEVLAKLAQDAFAPVLLSIALVALSPIGDIPGAPTLLSLLIILVSVQMIIGRSELWLPEFLANRKIKGKHLCKVVDVSRPTLRFLGYLIRPRMTFLTEGLFGRVIASVCGILALTLPPLEFVPFGATIPSTIIAILSIALVARDGLLVLLATVVLFAASYYAFTQLV